MPLSGEGLRHLPDKADINRRPPLSSLATRLSGNARQGQRVEGLAANFWRCIMTLRGLLMAANMTLNPADPAALQPLVDPPPAPTSICEPLKFDERLAPPGALVDINDGCTNDGCATAT